MTYWEVPPSPFYFQQLTGSTVHLWNLFVSSDCTAARGSRGHFRGRGGAAWGLHLASSLYLLARIVKKINCHLRAPRRGIGLLDDLVAVDRDDCSLSLES